MLTEEIGKVFTRCYVLNGILQNQCIDMVESSWHRRWKPPFILGLNSKWIRKFTRTQDSRPSRMCSTSLKNIFWKKKETFQRNSECESCLFWRRFAPAGCASFTSLRRPKRRRDCVLSLYCTVLLEFYMKIERTHFCRKQNCQMFNAHWNMHHNHGRDQHSSTINRSNGRKQNLVSTLILFYVLVGWNKVQSSRKMEKPSWRSQDVSSYQDVVGIDGETIELEMKISRIFDIVCNSRNPESFGREDNPKRELRGPDHLHVNVQWHSVENRWWDLHLERWESQEVREDNKMVQQLKEIVHPIITITSAWSRGILKQKRGRITIHFNGDTVNTELLFQTVQSVNQISVCAAVTDWCYQFGSTNEEKGSNRHSCGQWNF